MAQEKTFGLLSQYGLDLGTPDDVRSQLRQQRIKDAMTMVPPPMIGAGGRSSDFSGAARSAGMLGAAIGNAFGEKFHQSQSGYGNMPPEIQNRLSTVQQTKDGFSKWEADNKEATAPQRQEKYQEMLADAAFRNDLPDVGIGVLRDLQDRRFSTQKQQAELEKLGYDNSYSKATLDSRVALEMYKANKEGVVQFYDRNSLNPNSGQTGRLDQMGRITTADGRVLGVGDYTFDRPEWFPNYGGGGSGKGGQDLTPTAEEGLRTTFANAMTMNTGLVGVLDLVKEAGLVGAGNPLGLLGKTTSLVDKYSGYVQGLFALASPDGKMPTTVTMTDSKGRALDGNFANAKRRAKWAAENEAFVRNVIPNLPKKAEYANRFIAQVTELAYLKAMSAEGGSTRSLSDNDFKNAMISIGGNLNNPETLAKVLLADSDRLHSKILDRFSTYSDDTIKRVIDPKAFARYDESRTKLEAYRSGELFKQPAAPSAPAAPKAGSLPLRAGWTQEDWNELTPDEQRTLSGLPASAK